MAAEVAGAKPAFDAKAEMEKLAKTRAGGAYIPPHRMRQMMAEMDAKDTQSEAVQRARWDALRKSIQGLVNKVNVGNIKFIVPELFGENLIRGRGLFARSVIRAQASSIPFTPVFAALVAIINTKLPQIGELVVTRLVAQFRKAFRRNDKVTCVAAASFLAHLVNQQVASEFLALQVILLLIEKPTDDSVEIAVGFMREVGAYLAQEAPRANNGIYDRFRAILHESQIDKRVQYMIEVLFQLRRDKFRDNPIIPEGLDLVEEEDIITHNISLDGDLKTEDMLNVFKFDPEYDENEERYANIKREILGDSDESGEEGSDEESDEEDEEGDGDGTVDIEDHTGTNLVNLRRRIYLTIMSALNFEEAVHKLLKMDIQEGEEIELCKMVVECCSQERTYTKFYGLIGERLCKLNIVWTQSFVQAFSDYYDTIHRYDTNKLRNIARFFAHLIASDAVPWSVFEVVKMNEEDTTSSSRIFIKIVMQEVSAIMGLKEMKERFQDPTLKPSFQGIFPMDNPKNTRFSINFFTSVGLGALTEEMREFLKSAPALIMQQRRALEAENASSSSDSDSSSDVSSSSVSSSSVSSSSSDSDSDSASNSDSDSDNNRRRRRPPPPRSRSRSRSSEPKEQQRTSKKRTPSPSPSRSPSPSPSPKRSRSRSPPASSRRRRRNSPSPSPPPRSNRRYSRSPTSPPQRSRYRSRSPPARRPRYD